MRGCGWSAPHRLLHAGAGCVEFTPSSNPEGLKGEQADVASSHPLDPAMAAVFNACAFCRTTENVTMRSSAFPVCGGCGISRYCGRGCQKAHWKAGHREECKALADPAKDANKLVNAFCRALMHDPSPDHRNLVLGAIDRACPPAEPLVVLVGLKPAAPATAVVLEAELLRRAEFAYARDAAAGAPAGMVTIVAQASIDPTRRGARVPMVMAHLHARKEVLRVGPRSTITFPGVLVDFDPRLEDKTLDLRARRGLYAKNVQKATRNLGLRTLPPETRARLEAYVEHGEPYQEAVACPGGMFMVVAGEMEE
jgi:hypothetical protein